MSVVYQILRREVSIPLYATSYKEVGGKYVTKVWTFPLYRMDGQELGKFERELPYSLEFHGREIPSQIPIDSSTSIRDRLHVHMKINTEFFVLAEGQLKKSKVDQSWSVFQSCIIKLRSSLV